MADGQYSGRSIWVSNDSERKMCIWEKWIMLYIWFKPAYCESKLSHKIFYSQLFYWLERDLIEHLIKVSYFVGKKTETQQDYILSKVTH